MLVRAQSPKASALIEVVSKAFVKSSSTYKIIKSSMRTCFAEKIKLCLGKWLCL